MFNLVRRPNCLFLIEDGKTESSLESVSGKGKMDLLCLRRRNLTLWYWAQFVAFLMLEETVVYPCARLSGLSAWPMLMILVFCLAFVIMLMIPIMHGVPLAKVSSLLGHTSPTMTLRYAHLSPKHLTSAVRVLDPVSDSFSPVKVPAVQFPPCKPLQNYS
jgi:hypothetical protein